MNKDYLAVISEIIERKLENEEKKTMFLDIVEKLINAESECEFSDNRQIVDELLKQIF